MQNTQNCRMTNEISIEKIENKNELYKGGKYL